MKSFVSKLNVPLILLLLYSTYFIYLIQVGVIITLPIALIFAFLVSLYCFYIYMEHIKKPEPHKELEAKWEKYIEQFNSKIEKLDGKITTVNMSQMKSGSNVGVKHGW